MNAVQYQAGGTIYPCRFIKVSTSAPFTALQAGANDAVCGISAEGTTVVPIEGMTDGQVGYAATTGMAVSYWAEHCECVVEAGAAISVGAYLVSDADGKAVTATSSNHNIGAVALEAATAAGQKIRVKVEFQRTAIPS